MTLTDNWGDMFRAHTCFKALCAMVDRVQAGDHAEIKSRCMPPCRPCRAWWRQLCARKKVTVRITWPDGVWAIPECETPPAQRHNVILTSPEVEADGFTVLAIENQSCARWAFRTGDEAEDPEVYQATLGDEEYGPWTPLGMRRSAFLEAMELWNDANGGVSPSLVGQLSSAPADRLASSPVLLVTPWFKVHIYDDVRLCVAGDDVYAWGADVERMRHIARALPLAWSDLE